MSIKGVFVLPTLFLAAGSCFGANINSLHVEFGTWDVPTSSFTRDGSDWNTFNGSNWAIGATAPGFGNPVLDGFNSVDLPDGEYYLYMATDLDSGATAMQITLGYASGVVVEDFTSTSVLTAGPYTLVSGSGFTASLVAAPQSTFTAVGSGQRYFPTGEANWIIDLNSSTSAPEPGTTSMLLIAGLGALAFARQKAAR